MSGRLAVAGAAREHLAVLVSASRSRSRWGAAASFIAGLL
jgi:hypothetical protein